MSDASTVTAATGPVLRHELGEARALVERLVMTPALRELVEADGHRWPEGDLDTVVAELERHAAVAWDFRRGKSRLMFKDSTENRTNARAELVYRAGRNLGLIDSPPPTMTTPDHLVILATGVEPRTRYAAELLAARTVDPGHIAALGSFRPLHEREHRTATAYAPTARNEIQLLAAMTRLVLGGTGPLHITTNGVPTADPARACQIRRWPGPPPVAVYAARSSRPDHRPANTIDTYHQFAADTALRPDQQVLIITSSIYRPYQHLDALRALGTHGIEIETVGVPSTPGTAPAHPPSAYLQEIRSTIRSAAALLAS